MSTYLSCVHAAVRGLATVGQAFGRSERAGISLVYALSIVPVIGLAGLAIDYGRAFSLRTTIQAAADAALMATALRADLDESEAEAYAETYFRQALHGEIAGDLGAFALDRLDGSLKITTEARIGTSLLKVLGHTSIDIGVASEIHIGGGPVEVALVLDNTGSMRDTMDELKSGATDLVNKIFDAAEQSGDPLSVAVVPYVGAVNIGTGGAQLSWMDGNGDARWHGQSFEYYWSLFQEDCTYTPDGSYSPPDAGSSAEDGDDRSSAVDQQNRSFAAMLHEAFGIRSASAVPANNVVPSSPGGYTRQGPDPTNAPSENCWAAEPSHVNHFDLYDQMGGGAAWKGCVEARAEPYDVDDTPPDLGDPDTLFVPYLWPDDADTADNGYAYPNNYMDDGAAALPAGMRFSWEGGRARSTLKYYAGPPTAVDDSPPETHGPNQACPDPIMPLSETRNDVLDKIAGLSHWEGSGTVASEGVAWGWRVLSPGEPFTEGGAYNEVKKVIVLMTDGKNWASTQGTDVNFTDYTAYGYLRYGRLSPETFDSYKTHIDDRMLLACENAKAEGVMIFTITFGALDAATEALYESCATRTPFHYDADTGSELVAAFKAIGNEISALRLVK